EGKQPGRAAGGKAERVGDLLSRQPEQTRRRGGRTEYTDGAGWMKAALAQIRMAGARDGDDRLIADHDGLERGATANTGLVTEPDDRGNRSHAGMDGALPIAVIQFDAMAGRAGDISCIKQIGAALAAGHRNPAGGANPGQHGFRTAREIATR